MEYIKFVNTKDFQGVTFVLNMLAHDRTANGANRNDRIANGAKSTCIVCNRFGKIQEFRKWKKGSRG